jgi:putative transposase
MENIHHLSQRVFHIYNRSNDRSTLFHEDQNYAIFIAKMVRQMTPAAHLLAYCVMPNHFHVLLVPRHPLHPCLRLDGEIEDRLPTHQLSSAVQNWLMGYTRSYNSFYNLKGSRFQQHSRAKYHTGSIQTGLDYIHNNPVKARLVTTPDEWGYSSYNEYVGLLAPADCICEVELGRRLLLLS